MFDCTTLDNARLICGVKVIARRLRLSVPTPPKPCMVAVNGELTPAISTLPSVLSTNELPPPAMPVAALIPDI